MAIEEPKYSVLEKAPPFELRSYAPMILAEVQVEGDLDEASGQGFRLIAAYIFGQNQVSEKIAMTTPVAVEEQPAKSAKIAMTTPVNIESKAGQWVVSFVMPSEYTMETLPKPLNSKVQIRQIPAVKRAVITFSGFYNSQKVAERVLELEEWMKTHNLSANGSPKFARYNPPWTLPFMRRNEIMIDVRD
ncbi:heme-binding protein [Polynucleobacter sp. es-GGE-1]|nr:MULTISPECIES: heme-binding protein [unclassified Polynucleobacter]MBU3632449.1 heme-binding protein [Polynucleobacter sp. AP-Feld-500C-C5]MBU3634999.1 heme-binding protein [Polynucleobacter sp. es-GGE-1]QWD69803.1 heme-binding protein [Polynucleobacter sp. UB-Siik-W21]QWE05965.1 heme-binding protein [Polynucleobacter sp. JS-JIR-5-A7]